MKFNISGFTHIGTVRESNQDNILVNGQILNEGEIHIYDQEYCFCFVADGVGGNKAGEYASHFVLERLNSITDFSHYNIDNILMMINKQLLAESLVNDNIKGTATTLTGLIFKENILNVFHAGDSQIWLLRNEMFFQITLDHVLDELELNSPITSYFGGLDNNLKLERESAIQELFLNDIFLICSDGLFKSLNPKFVKSILSEDEKVEIKAKKILENCLQLGAEDNTSIILIHQIK